MARTSNEDPLKVFNFVVEIEGFGRFGFAECSGLESETDVSEYREGGAAETPQKSAGLTKFTDITLRRGVVLGAGQNDFYEWASQVHSKGAPPVRDYRRDPEIVQFERGGTEAIRHRVYNAFPIKFKAVPNLTALENGPVIQELVLAHEGFEIV